MTPALGIALGNGYPTGFFSETTLTLGAVVRPPQLLPTTVAAVADPTDVKLTASTAPIPTSVNRFLMGSPCSRSLTGRADGDGEHTPHSGVQVGELTR
jgi:hypothetical protein